MGHCAQVALEAAPVAALKVPAAQGEAVEEERGQKWPGGQITGTPEAQWKEAGQGTHVSWRTRALNVSATKRMPVA